jgi:hypothetical protein
MLVSRTRARIYRGGLRAGKAITYFSRPTPRPLVRELTLEERSVSRWFRPQKFIADSSPMLIYWQNGLTSVEIQNLLTFLTTSGVAIYVVGLVGLAIAMRLHFTDDVSTAWYAVALLPRTIVAGQGVRIWLRWTVPYAIFAAGLGALVVGFLKAGNLAVTAVLVPLIPASGLGLLALFYVAILNYMQKEDNQSKEEEKRQKGAKQPELSDTRFKWLPYLLNSVLKWLFPPTL